MAPGVYKALKKDGTLYFRASITYKGKHISLGSFKTEEEAALAYVDASTLLSDESITLLNIFSKIKNLSFEKAITLLNFRDHGIYIKTPIYLQRGFFLYYLSKKEVFKFDNDDLFYYSSHKIIKRNGHLFVNDYGMQYNILSRFGIKPFAVAEKDYIFANGDVTDFRYSNVIVINHYHGVSKYLTEDGIEKYIAKMHLNGDYIIGRYSSEAKAAVAYNKAVDYARDRGYEKNFIENYVSEYSAKEYADVYTSVKISKKFMEYIDKICM